PTHNHLTKIPLGYSALHIVGNRVALARQCLHRRIPTLEQLEREVLALIQQRHDRRLTLHWQFSIPTARDKLNRHYARVQADNRKFKYS
ncbi:MAG: hypothetical protein WBE39_17785, partial [Candidatus Competibacter sp.]